MKNTFDVIVIGGGGAGLAAAIEARQTGASVLLLEKNPQLGGSTSWSVGSITATQTTHQKAVGISDSPDEHFEDLGLHAGALAPRDNLVLRRVLVDNVSATMTWLMSLGLVFIGPMPDPPHRYDRMHNVVPNSRAFAFHLGKRCRKLGVQIRLGTVCRRLVEQAGRVVGVTVDGLDGTEVTLHARRGIVLATGDFSNSPELKARFAAAKVVNVSGINVTATGDGQRMAMELGASVLNGDIVRGPIMRFIAPQRVTLAHRLPPYTWMARAMAWSIKHLPSRILRPFLMSFLTTALGPSPELFQAGAVLVNRKGERFTDERDRPNMDVADQPDRQAWIVFDQKLASKFDNWPNFISTAPGVAYAYLADYRRNRADIFHQAADMAGLARSAGFDTENFIRTIAQYNQEQRSDRPSIAEGPFYALGPVCSYVVFTDGGLAVTPQLEVLRNGTEPIPGLFAAGSTGQGGLLLEGHGHHLGWAFTSGRIAGRNAANSPALTDSGRPGM